MWIVGPILKQAEMEGKQIFFRGGRGITFMKHCPQRMSTKKCQQKMSKKSFQKKCPQKVSTKTDREQKVTRRRLEGER